MESELAAALRVLIKELNQDQGYRRSWEANIAMAFKDEYSRLGLDADPRTVADNAAKNFLNQLCR